MRFLRLGLTTIGCFAVMGFTMPAGEMPAKTVRLSTMMQELSSQPGFSEAFLAEVQGGGRKKSGAALLTPALVHRLWELMVGKDWEGLDHFPGWTMGEINPTVRVVGHVVGKDEKVDGLATQGGRPTGDPMRSAMEFIDLGEYRSAAGAKLDEPATGKGFDEKVLVASLGNGVTRGDGPNELAPMHAESERLADVLNRLSLNSPQATEVGMKRFDAMVGGQTVKSPEGLIAALLGTGHTVEVADARYFANFGHLHYKGQDVMMPFYVNTEIRLPGTRRPLLVPVAHAEYEWRIAGPKVNAAVSFYFGIDGKAEFRTMDQLDQAWVMKRKAHEYRGADAVEVTRLAGAMVRAYMRLHGAHPALPFGGYYAFGVCQDVIAAVELKMTGEATLFPNTADDRFFTDPRDAEINALILRLPKDRAGKPPDAARIFGSLPVGSSDAELATVSIPGLGERLIAVHHAWTDGTLERTGGRRRRWALTAGGVVLLIAIVAWMRRRR